MLTDQEILDQAAQRFKEFRESKQWWLTNEVQQNYMLDAGDQWTTEDYDKYKADGIPTITINKTSPVIDSVAGFEILNRSEAKYSPRSTDDETKADFAQIAESGVNFIERKSKVAFHNSIAFRDMLMCGVGAVDMTIEYSKDDTGLPHGRRIFPAFFMYDAAVREKNMEDANWLAEAKIVDERVFSEEYDVDGEDGVFSFNDTELLQYFDILQSAIPLTVAYCYQWRVKEPHCRVENPFFDLVDEMLIMNYAASAEKTYGFSLEDGVLGFTPANYAKFKKDCAALGIELGKMLKKKKYVYYRALIGLNRVLEKSVNYSQSGFSTSVMTGKFDEKRQCYYGMVRAMRDPQRVYNRTISDLQGFLNTSSKGGVIIESDATDDLQGFIKTYAKAKHVTVVAKGALSLGKVQQKQTAAIPSGIPDLLNVSGMEIFATAGINPEWMGMMQSKDMTSALQTKIVKQVLSVLAIYFDAKKFFTIDQGRLFLDMLRILAENNPGRLIPVKDGDKYMKLFASDIAKDYDVDIVDTPMTTDERAELFDKLMELTGILLQSGVNIAPVAIKYAPIDKKDTEEIQQMMLPPPPPQPDPVNQALIQSTTALNVANAQKISADAKKINLELLTNQRSVDTDLEQLTANLAKTKSEVQLNTAKTAATLINP